VALREGAQARSQLPVGARREIELEGGLEARLAKARGEQPGRSGDGVALAGRRREGLAIVRHERGEQVLRGAAHQLRLRGEVLEQRALGDAGAATHLGGGSVRVAALREGGAVTF